MINGILSRYKYNNKNGIGFYVLIKEFEIWLVKVV